MVRFKNLRLYKFTLLLLYVSSLRPWFMEYVPSTIIYIFGAVISILFFLSNKNYFQFEDKRKYILASLFIFFIWNSFRDNILPSIGYYIELVPLSLLILLRVEIKNDIFKYLTNWMALICGITIPFYVVFLLGVPLQSEIIQYDNNDVRNYYFFITETNPFFLRFSSIFYEPGFLSIGIIPLLYINKLNLKNPSVLILLVAAILSFSLAGLILLFCMLIIFSFDKNNNRLKNWSRVIVIFFFIIASTVITNLKEDNYLYLTIASRMKFDETTGTIRGNNRTSEDMKYLYENTKDKPQIIYGLGRNRILFYYEIFNMRGGNAGFVIYIMTYGIIGVFFAIVFFATYFYNFKSYNTLGLSLIFIALLYQNCYWNWSAVLFAFILGTEILHHQNKKTKNNNRYDRTIVLSSNSSLQ